MRRGGFPFPPFLLSLADNGRVNLKNEVERVVKAKNVYEAAAQCLWWFGEKRSGMGESEQVVAAQKLAMEIRRYYKNARGKPTGSKKAKK